MKVKQWSDFLLAKPLRYPIVTSTEHGCGCGHYHKFWGARRALAAPGLENEKFVHVIAACVRRNDQRRPMGLIRFACTDGTVPLVSLPFDRSSAVRAAGGRLLSLRTRIPIDDGAGGEL